MRFLLSLLFATAPLFAKEVTFIDNGKPEAVIVVAPGASPTEHYAARELQYHIEKISGAQLPIQPEAGAQKAFVITTLGDAPALAETLQAGPLDAEEILVKMEAERLYLTGKTPRAVLYATYTFLQEQLGCRWYWPGSDGEYIPTRATITFGDLFLRQRPALNYRTFSINHPHYDEATDIWMARQRLNVRTLQSKFPADLPRQLHEKGFKVAIGGHNMTLPQALLEAHPEYAAEVAGIRSTAKIGKRQTHLCWSNPGVEREIVAQLRAWVTKNPHIDALSLGATDHTLFCECRECLAMAADPSTRWQLFCAKIIQPLKKEFPEKEFWALAYQAYRDVPAQVSSLNNIWYCAYNADYLRPLLDAPASNSSLKREMLAWKERGGIMSLRGYEFIPFSEPMWTPLLRYVVQEKKWLRDHGLAGASSEVAPRGHPREKPEESQGWTVNRLSLYASAQAMWNADLSPADLLKDWTAHLYGPAAEAMERFYNLMEAAWLGQEEPLTYFLHPPTLFASRFLSPELLEKADACFQEARAQAVEPRQADQIDLEARMLQRWRTFFTYARNRKAHNETFAIRSATPPRLDASSDDPTWRSVAALPPFEDSREKEAADATEVKLLWDNEALYLRFLCHDRAAGDLIAKYRGHDENIFTDDAVELFLQWKSGEYGHLAFNSTGARYDAITQPGGGFDTAWNPEWRVNTDTIAKTAKVWIADVTLPFKSFAGITPETGSAWRVAFKRSRPAARRVGNPDIRNTGWPDASYHNPHSFGQLSFVKELPTRRLIVLYNAGQSGENLMGELLKRHFDVLSVDAGESNLAAALEKNPAALLIRYGNGRHVGLSEGFLREKITPYLENGGTVFLAAAGEVPLERWFDNAALGVQWSGWQVDARRKTSNYAEGEWSAAPNDLRAAFARRISPASAFLPSSDGWTPLASLKLQDQRECPYLLKATIGSGVLYLTSSAMSYSGGGEIFGRMHPGNAAALVENLLEPSR